jgi:Family of unknown function (DUF5999)
MLALHGADHPISIRRHTMCRHYPKCPSANATDRDAAHVIASHPEQGWSLLCNGVVSFDDEGDLLPDGRSIPPQRDQFHYHPPRASVAA